jgi:hypothetical protein
MKLPYGANEDDFENIKKIVSEFTNNDKNLDESTLEIMNIAYSTGGDYSDETLLAYVKAYFEMNSTNLNLPR